MPLFKEQAGIPNIEGDENVVIGAVHVADPFAVGVPTGDRVTADKTSQRLISMSKLRHKSPGQLIGPGTRDFNPDIQQGSGGGQGNQSTIQSILQKIKLT